MLREQEFYDAYDAGHQPPARSIQEKATVLFELFEEQVQVLIENRLERLHNQRQQLSVFLNADFAVNQTSMRFVL